MLIRPQSFSLALFVSFSLFVFACAEDATDGTDTTLDLGGFDSSDLQDQADTQEDIVDAVDAVESDTPTTDVPIEDQPPADGDVGVDDPVEDGRADASEPDSDDIQQDVDPDIPDVSDVDVSTDGPDDVSHDLGTDLVADASDADADTSPPAVRLAYGTLEEGDFGRATLEIVIENPVSVGGFKLTTTNLVWDIHEAAFGGRAAEEGFSFGENYANLEITGYSLTGTAILPPTDTPVVLLKVRFVYPPEADETCLTGVLLNDKVGDIIDDPMPQIGPCYCFSGACD